MIAFAYADAVVIISPTYRASNQMVSICESYANEVSRNFIPDKRLTIDFCTVKPKSLLYQ